MSKLREINSNLVLSVLGLGYVGLPVALAFSNKYRVRGFDIDAARVSSLQRAEDASGEIDTAELREAKQLTITGALEDLQGSDVFIVTVPTPVDHNNEPDLSFLRLASESVADVMAPGAVVIFESTVYPGATEEECLPILESRSGLRCNVDFHLGYSPERINPGDKTHRLRDVVKITSGSNAAAADFVDDLYKTIVTAGTHRAPSIKVAEAAKVIENIQRDLNIALVNEFSQVFERLKLDTGDILEAARTKWNFLPFTPGLVGGHCIGVDPYYLTHRALQANYTPEVILAGRRINNDMPRRIANRVDALLKDAGKRTADASILVLGISFKENCPDTRNSKAVDLVNELTNLGAAVDVFDPVVAQAGVKPDLDLIKNPIDGKYDAIVGAVQHAEFVSLGIDAVKSWGTDECVIFDIKHMFPQECVTARL